MAAEADRDPDGLGITIFGAEGKTDILKGYQDAGVERTVFTLPSAGSDEVLPLLDKYAELIG